MVLEGLTLPEITDVDPGAEGESGLDPLGLSAVAEDLVDLLTSEHLTARMQRVRFLTAIAACAAVLNHVDVDLRGDTEPQLAFEWLVVQAMAQAALPQEATRSVPGIGKARAARLRGEMLDARSYLKVPAVFGFHGVYKRLARGLRIVDKQLLLDEVGYSLLHEWERDAPSTRAGFADAAGGTPGGDLNRSLQGAVRRALERGGIAESAQVHLWRKLADAFRPDGAGRREATLLWEALIDLSPQVAELLGHLDSHPPNFAVESELDVLADLRATVSVDLRRRVDTVAAYERLASLLYRPFQAVQWEATVNGTVPVPLVNAADLPTVAHARAEVDHAVEAAATACSGVDPAMPERVAEIADRFVGTPDAAAFVDALLGRHRAVQDVRDKQPWFDELAAGLVLRTPYRLEEEPPGPEAVQVHPVRIVGLASFRADLKGRA
ncbi:MAG: hypothetical protein K1X95_09085 [Acidimicrobiia bacterium]|nr:hypothetical protein [Acidimicrobiia bacterium]